MIALRAGTAPALWLVWAWSAAAAAAGITSPDGQFSTAQAEQGRELYGRQCAGCHGPALEGASAGALRGEDFLVRWSAHDQTVADLYYVTRTNMPLGQGGSLSNGEYIDLVAYMLAENGYRAGDSELPADPDSLQAIPVGDDRSRALAAERPPGCPEERFHDPSPPATTTPTRAQLAAADDAHDDWLLPDQGYAGRRFSTLAQVTPANVATLAEVCTFDTGVDDAAQSAPLAHAGTLYFTTHHATWAVDGATCQLKWRHERAPRCVEMWGRSRGAAIQDGLLVRGTTDGYLLALELATGRRVWERRVSETDQAGGAIAMPPLVHGDLVIAGPAPSETGLKGWIGAFDLYSGERRWIFHTVPEAGDPAAATWGNVAALERGGGGVWTPFTLDARRGVVYAPVANPGPAYAPDNRPGANLYTNSVVALDVASGRLLWHRQMLPADYHDWDLTHAGPLFTVAAAAGRRNVIAVTGKDGMLHVIDRDSHALLFAIPVVRRENTDAPLHTDRDTHFCPGLYGGVQWNGAAVDEAAGRLFVPAVEWCASLRRNDEVRFIPGSFYIGGSFRMDDPDTARGHLTAWDAATGTRLWRHESPRPMLAGVVSTANGLVLAGELNGDFVALDAATGRVLLRRNLGAPLGGGLITYTAAGRQFVAVVAGNPSSLWPAGPGSARVVLLSLPR